MKFTLQREHLLQGLQFISGVIERRQNMPILGNVLMTLRENTLTLTASDSEIELNSRILITTPKETEHQITLPGRKLIDILKQLPSEEFVHFESKTEDKVSLQAGKSRFTLAGLPPQDFPLMSFSGEKFVLQLDSKQLLQLMTSTAFAMAEQDVRYYMNGLYFEVMDDFLTSVATDGHRLAVCRMPFGSVSKKGLAAAGFILPRKAVLELMRVLGTHASDASILLDFKCAKNSIQCETEKFSFHSRLIEGNFPNYQKVIPKDLGEKALIEKSVLKQILQRMLILAQDKFPAVILSFKRNLLVFSVRNTQNEQADDEMVINYTGKDTEIAFNVHYLLDAISILPEGDIQICFSEGKSGSVCVFSENLPNVTNVIMPMTL